MAHDKTLRFTVDLRSLDTVRLGQVARECMVISPSWDSTEWWVHKICERILTPIFMGCATFTYLQDRFSPIHFPCFSLLPTHFTDLVWMTVFIITSGEPYRRTLMTTQVNPLTLPEPANGTTWPVASRWRDEKKKASKRWLKLGCIVWRVSILESCTSASNQRAKQLTLNLNSYVRSYAKHRSLGHFCLVNLPKSAESTPMILPMHVLGQMHPSPTCEQQVANSFDNKRQDTLHGWRSSPMEPLM